MPDSRQSVGKADEFYAVARSIPNNEWNAFARGETFLGLPESTIDDIQVDHKNISEQKFQMILKWEQREGRDATAEYLKQLRDNFLGRRDRSSSSAPILPQISCTRTNDFSGRRKQADFRALLVHVANTLTDDQFRQVKRIYGSLGDNVSDENAAVYFAEMDDQSLWGTSIQEKVERVEALLISLPLERSLHEGIYSKIDQLKRAFDGDQSSPQLNSGGRSNPAAGSSRQSSMHQSASAPSVSGQSGSPQNDLSIVPQQPSSSYQTALSAAAPSTSAQNMSHHSGSYHGPPMASVPNQSMPIPSASTRDVPPPNESASNRSASPHQSGFHLSHQRYLTETDGPSSSLTVTASNLTASNLVSGLGSIHVTHHNVGESQQPSSCADSNEQLSNPDSKAFFEPTDRHTRSMPDLQSSPRDICTYAGTSVTVSRSAQEHYFQHLSDEEIYRVQRKPKGYALIISNVKFPVWGRAYYRNGGKNDCELMRNLFGENGLGLQTIVCEDLTREVMWKTLEDFSKDGCHRCADMCVVIIMSHGLHITGEGDAIFGSDGISIFAEDVVRLFDNDNCPLLRNKPKMFFFQFCRGDILNVQFFVQPVAEPSFYSEVVADRGVTYDTVDRSYPSGSLPSIAESLQEFDTPMDEADVIEHLPRRSDVLIAFATQEGNLSFRSWFTNALANVFSEHAHDRHVCDMLKMVKSGLAQKVSRSNNPELNECKEMADVRDMLRKNIYFFPGFP